MDGRPQAGSEHGDLQRMFEALEQQAAGLELAERDAELADRSVAEYAGVTLMSRVHASLGNVVTLGLVTGDRLTGVVEDAGVDWLSVTEAFTGRGWVVAEGGLVAAEGLSVRAVPELARPALSRRRLAAAVRHLGASLAGVTLHGALLGQVPGRLCRVGADFLEVESAMREGRGAEVLVVPLRAVAAVSEQ